MGEKLYIAIWKHDEYEGMILWNDLCRGSAVGGVGGDVNGGQ
jgi:hypothetical protein